MTPEFKKYIEMAIIASREAQKEIHSDGSTYEQLDNIRYLLEEMIEEE